MGKKRRQQQPKSITSPAAPAFRLPKAVVKHGEALLEQQMWCWGCDVRRQEGNLLVAYGAEKRPSPDPRYHSAYTCTLYADCVLTLWGWGVWIACDRWGSLFLSRSRFRVSYTSDVHLYPQAWQADDLPDLKSPCDPAAQTHTRCLLAEAIIWIGDYEHWLADHTEPHYREAAIATWPQRRRYRGGIPSADLAQTWLNLSKLLRKESLN